MRIQAWAPGHATLIFSVPNQFSDPNQRGSLGVGLNFKTGVLTKISEAESNIVKWNSFEINGKVSLTALSRFQELTNTEGNFEINHYSELKIGHGLSTSGAGALGVVLCLNKYYKLSLSETEIYKIAHYADVINHTGLGSVMGQITGGIEVRTKQGGPEVGDTVSIRDSSKIIILMMNKLKTSDVLKSDDQMFQVNNAGIETLDNLIQNLSSISLKRVLDLGRAFTEKCGLMTEKVRNTLHDLERLGENTMSMAMIGETIIIKPVNGNNILEYAQKHRIDAVVTKISNESPRIVTLED